MKYDIKKYNITSLCREIVLGYYDLLYIKGYDVEINIPEYPIFVQIDKKAAIRIIKNIIDNAIKYGNAGKFLGISLYKKDNHIYIEVEDHGAGISEKDKIHIFTRAYTADRKKGNGLGLAISQELANSMGGSISVVSIPQEKTVFTIRL